MYGHKPLHSKPVISKIVWGMAVSLFLIVLILTLLETGREQLAFGWPWARKPDAENIVLRAMFIHLMLGALIVCRYAFSEFDVITWRLRHRIYLLVSYLLVISWSALILKFFDQPTVNQVRMINDWVGLLSLPVPLLLFIYTLQIYRNIEEKLKQEQELSGMRSKALRDSELKYRSLVEHALIGVYIVEKKGILNYVNPRFAQIFGTSQEELIGTSIWNLVHPEDLNLVTTSLQKRLAGEVKSQRYSFRGITRDNKIIDVEVHGTIICLNGESAIIGTLIDITDRKQAEELFRKSDKLNVIGQLAAGVAHEIRNPLTSLRGFVQLLKETGSEGNNEYFKIMLSELDRINLIVSELLTLAKPQALNFLPKDISKLLHIVIRLLNVQANMQNVQIVTEFDPGVLLVKCDENQLKQVFINLIKNAIESIPHDGSVTVAVHRVAPQNVMVRVTDTGCGIPEGLIPNLGDPFFTTKEKGTGLGLMVSYRIIEDHGGTIKIHSEVGKGTVVDVILPLEQPEGGKSTKI